MNDSHEFARLAANVCSPLKTNLFEYLCTHWLETVSKRQAYHSQLLSDISVRGYEMSMSHRLDQFHIYLILVEFYKVRIFRLNKNLKRWNK